MIQKNEGFFDFFLVISIGQYQAVEIQSV